MENYAGIRLVRFILFGMIAWGFHACNDDEIIDRQSENQEFVKEAYSSNQLEIAAGTLVNSQGDNEAIKAFGLRMQEEHTAVGNELRALASEKAWVIPSTMNGRHQELLDLLEDLEGTAFDSEYLDIIIETHKEAIALFERGQGLPDIDLRTFASSKLPALRTHLAAAESLRLELNDDLLPLGTYDHHPLYPVHFANLAQCPSFRSKPALGISGAGIHQASAPGGTSGRGGCHLYYYW